MARLVASKATSASRTRLLRAAGTSASLVSAAGAWAAGRPGMAVFLLVTVHLGIPLCNLFIRSVATPLARGAGRALEPGVQGSVERLFRRLHAQADRKLCAVQQQDQRQPTASSRSIRHASPAGRRQRRRAQSTTSTVDTSDAVLQVPIQNHPSATTDAGTTEGLSGR